MPAVAPKGTVAGVQIWAKPLGGGKTAALFINGGPTEYTASIGLKELNITGERLILTPNSQTILCVCLTGTHTRWGMRRRHREGDRCLERRGRRCGGERRLEHRRRALDGLSLRRLRRMKYRSLTKTAEALLAGAPQRLEKESPHV